ncbi:hypothetical protein KC335_g53 [Hortaea werneckii]|nr:hypothetical protein KC335_g53 [Hortaea werneckii]
MTRQLNRRPIRWISLSSGLSAPLYVKVTSLPSSLPSVCTLASNPRAGAAFATQPSNARNLSALLTRGFCSHASNITTCIAAV